MKQKYVLEMKEFLEKNKWQFGENKNTGFIHVFNSQEMFGVDFFAKFKQGFMVTTEDLGLFFWERGGKQFVKSTFEQYPKIRSVEDLVLSFETAMNNPLASKFRCVWGQDFLDALDCLGEGEIEKRIDLLKES